MTAVASARKTRMADALSAGRTRLAHARGDCGRMPMKLNYCRYELLPAPAMVLIFGVSGVEHLVGESRDRSGGINKARKSRAVGAGDDSAGTWSGGFRATKRVDRGGVAAHSVDSSRV